jgi:chromosome segregation ATPase
MSDTKLPEATDPFTRCVRQVGEQAAKIQRLEELITSTRAQTEHFLQQRLILEAELNREREENARLRHELTQLKQATAPKPD